MATLDAVTTSYLETLMAARSADWERITELREYAAGTQTAQLTTAQKKLLVGENGADPEFALNICETILDVEVNRLDMRQVTISLPDSENEAAGETLTTLARRWWDKSRMDEGQQNVFYSAARDGASYLVVYYDPPLKDVAPDQQPPRYPRLAFNAQYDGVSSGVEMFYEDDDPSRPIAAVKTWGIGGPDATSKTAKRRRDVYYKDHIEYWISDSQLTGAASQAGWRALQEGDTDYDATIMVSAAPSYPYLTRQTATISWWTEDGTETGTPLGIPVIPFRRGARGSATGRSAIADVVPGLQNAINDAGVSVMAAAKLSGFKYVLLFGYDGAVGSIEIYPGGIAAIDDPTASAMQLSETNLEQLISVKNTFIKDAAMLTSTPLSFFNLSGDIPAEGTQKQLEAGLLAKIARDQVAFGNAFEDAFRMMLKLESVFGDGSAIGLPLEAIDDLEINCEWEPAETRNKREETELAIQRHKELNVPLETSWAEVGYEPQEIEDMKAAADLLRQQAMGQMAKAIAQAEQQGQPPQPQPGQPAMMRANGNGAQPVAD